ncbi:unnamed protein product [Rotaria socialis]|uniref:Uncharacterized protein n=1 Tax=Rotaria socialis TaxID=392032 RepID=A0A818KW11_9BILA|nr:unnamed protein product [Rotaria socialis]CAF4420730.1 unnamed protein product [Rotaria socialis]
MATNTSTNLENVENSSNADVKDNRDKKIENEQAKNVGTSSKIDTQTNESNTTTETSISEQSIVINDPVKVTITVVKSASTDKSQDTNASLSSSTTTTQKENTNDLTKLANTEASSSEQSITINDPVKVTITVVQGHHDDKQTGQSLLSTLSTAAEKVSDHVDDLTKIEKPKLVLSAQPSVLSDPITISVGTNSADENKKPEETKVAVGATVEENKEAVSAPTSAIPPAEDTAKTTETPAPSTSTEDKKEEAPAQTATTPAVDENKKSEEKTAGEKKDSEPALAAAAPAVDQSKEATPTTEVVTEEKKSEETVSTPVPAADTKPEETKVTVGAPVGEKKESASTTPPAESTIKPAETSTSTEDKKEEAPAQTATTPAVDENKKSEEKTADERKDSEPVLGAAAPAVEQSKEAATVTTSTAEVAKEEKKPEETASSSTPAAETKPEEKTVIIVASAEEKKESIPTPASCVPANDADNKATEAVSSTDKKKPEGAATSTTPVDEKKEPEPALSSSAPTVVDDANAKEDNAKTQAPTSSTATSVSNAEDEYKIADNFPIVKDNAKNLTDFQQKKAEYFFNVNLDIENKKFITWEDVEFYLLFHITAAGKESSGNSDLEARLSRAARALWEHIHDQVPSPDGEQDQLSLDQFLDTWASLIDYIMQNGKFPGVVQNLVDAGFELYSTKDRDEKPPTIQPSAFEQLFQKMNLGRPYAMMAYTFLSENSTKPLDADKINSVVRAVVTSSDDGHDSHFILPGFFKTIKNKSTEKDGTNPTPTPSEEISEKQTPSPTPPPTLIASQPQEPSVKPQQPGGPQQSGQQPGGPQQGGQQPGGPQQGVVQQSVRPQQSGGSQQGGQQQKGGPQQQGGQQQQGALEQLVRPQQSGGPPSHHQQLAQLPSGQQKILLQKLDTDVRRILQFYHIDDGDLVEVDDGPIHRLVLVHPERPLPSYIQHDKGLLAQLQNFGNVIAAPSIPAQYKTDDLTLSKPQGIEKSPAEESKPKVTLEERLSRGEAELGPTIPSSQIQEQNKQLPTGIHQVYPAESEAHEQDQQKLDQSQAQQKQDQSQAQQKQDQSQAQQKQDQSPDQQKQDQSQTQQKQDQSQASQSSQSPTLSSKNDEEKKKAEDQTKSEKSASPNASVPEQTEATTLSKEEEEKVVETVIKQLTPLVEQLVAAELRRVLSGQNSQDADNDFVPFPFMFASSAPMFASSHGDPSTQNFQQQQQPTNRQANFSGGPGSSPFIPPELLMTMMNDITRGGFRDGMTSGSFNVSPPRGAAGGPGHVEGFMIFGDDDQMMGGQPRNQPTRPGPR